MEIFNCLDKSFYLNLDGPYYAISNNKHGCIALAFEDRKYGEDFIKENINDFLSRGVPEPELKPIINSFEFMLLCARHGLAGIELLSENDQKSFNFCVRLEEFSSLLPTALSFNEENNMSYVKTRFQEYKEQTYSTIKDWQRYDILDIVSSSFAEKNPLRVSDEELLLFEIRYGSNMFLSLFHVPCRHNFNSLHGSIPFFTTIKDAIAFLNSNEFNRSIMYFSEVKTEFNDLAIDLSSYYNGNYQIVKIDDLKERLKEIDIPLIGFVINPNGTRDSMVYGNIDFDEDTFPVAYGISGTWELLNKNKFKKIEDRTSWNGSDSFYWNQINSFKLIQLSRSFSYESSTTLNSRLTDLEIDNLIELKFLEKEFEYEEMESLILPVSFEDEEDYDDEHDEIEVIKLLDEDYNSNVDKKLAGFYEEKINSYCIIYWDPVTGERDNPNYFKSFLDLILWLWMYECSRDFPIRMNGAHQSNGLFGVAAAIDKDYEITIHTKIRKQLSNIYKKISLNGYKPEDSLDLCGLINCYYKTIHIDLIGYVKDFLIQLDGAEKNEVFQLLNLKYKEELNTKFDYENLDTKGLKMAKEILGENVINKLSDRSKYFICSALSQLDEIGYSPQFDYAGISIGFVKALEYELGLIFEKFITNYDITNFDFDKNDSGERKLIGKAKNEVDHGLSLGEMGKLLNPTYIEKSELRLNLIDFINGLTCGRFLTSKSFYKDGVNKITKIYRNGGAHDSAIKWKTAIECKEYIVGNNNSDGILKNMFSNNN